MYTIGIDIGSSAVKAAAVCFKDNIPDMNNIVCQRYDKSITLMEILNNFIDICGKISGGMNISRLCVTGAGSKGMDKDNIRALTGLDTIIVDEFSANAEAGALFVRDTDTANKSKAFVNVCMGTGSSFILTKADEGAASKHFGGVGLGGGTISGLSRLMIGTDSFDEIERLSAKGDVSNTDLRIKDISPVPLPGLDMEVTCSNFAKTSVHTKKEDIAAGIVYMVLENICQSAVLSGSRENVKLYVLTGGLTAFSMCRYVTKRFYSLCGAEFIIPDNAQYATAIGAAVSRN